MPTIVQGQVSGLVATRWETSATVAINTNWFANDITFDFPGRKEFAVEDSFTVVKDTLQLFVPTATVVNVQYKFNGITKVMLLNGGTALTANAPIQFALILIPGSSYNVQHATGTQNVAAIITQSYNVDI